MVRSVYLIVFCPHLKTRADLIPDRDCVLSNAKFRLRRGSWRKSVAFSLLLKTVRAQFQNYFDGSEAFRVSKGCHICFPPAKSWKDRLNFIFLQHGEISRKYYMSRQRRKLARLASPFSFGLFRSKVSKPKQRNFSMQLSIRSSNCRSLCSKWGISFVSSYR